MRPPLARSNEARPCSWRRPQGRRKGEIDGLWLTQASYDVGMSLASRKREAAMMFGEWVRELLRAKGLTLRDVALKVRVNFTYLTSQSSGRVGHGCSVDRGQWRRGFLHRCSGRLSLCIRGDGQGQPHQSARISRAFFNPATTSSAVGVAAVLAADR